MGEDSRTRGITKATLDVERGVHEPPSWEFDREAHDAYNVAHRELSKRKGW